MIMDPNDYTQKSTISTLTVKLSVSAIIRWTATSCNKQTRLQSYSGLENLILLNMSVDLTDKKNKQINQTLPCMTSM